MNQSNLLNYHPGIKTKKLDGREMIWCGIRKKYLIKTPEEWVRQLCILWLVQELQVPAGLISIERKSAAAGRFDLLVYDKSGKPLLLIECKSPDVPLCEQTAFQWSRYNADINVPFGLLTNALASFSFRQSAKNCYRQIKNLPTYPEMLSIV